MKNRKISRLLAGFAVLLATAITPASLLSPAGAQTTQDCIGGGSIADCAGAGVRETDPQGAGATGAGATSRVNRAVALVINILSWIIGVVAVIMIVIGGFKYVLSNGDSNSITSAKNTILFAIVGLVVVALAQIIVRFVLDAVTG